MSCPASFKPAMTTTTNIFGGAWQQKKYLCKDIIQNQQDYMFNLSHEFGIVYTTTVQITVK